MKTINHVFRSLVSTLLALTFLTSLAQEISIPDPALNAAIRATLQKPNGPLTEQDLLSLTNLNARSSNVGSVAGLEAARNLTTLLLDANQLTDFSPSIPWTNLSFLDLGCNSLTNVSLPGGLSNLARLLIQGNLLTNLDLPEDLIALDKLVLDNNQLTHFTLPAGLTNLISLNVAENQLTSLALPAGLTKLEGLFLFANQLTNVSLPGDLTSLTSLDLARNHLTNVTLPAGMTNLVGLSLNENQLTSLTLPADLTSLAALDLSANQLPDLALPAGMTNLHSLALQANSLTHLTLPASLTRLVVLDLASNQLTSLNLPSPLNRLFRFDLSANRLTQFTLPAGLAELNELNLQRNQLSSFTLPAGLTNLHFFNIEANQLTNLTLPPGLNPLAILRISGNQLADLRLPADLTNLFFLDLSTNQLTRLELPAGLDRLLVLSVAGNQLTSLTLPPDLTGLMALHTDGNPLSTFVLPETLAASNLAGTVAALQEQGVSVFTYPLSVRLFRLRQPIGAFQFALTGPPGVYTILGSADLAAWSVLDAVTNTLGTVVYTDVEAHLSPRKFYRAVRQVPPANMVFIPPNTFTMGSPVNEQDRNVNEGPQTTVTLTRGFWIGKYEVTQTEYLSVTGTNPSQFPGDLSRPVSSVSWPDATNYCWLLTQRERAAGHISPDSQYRLPTEAEWECAARAGTSTRFSYGDDPLYADLANYAWQSLGDGLTVHPVGLKLPNPWGLYDMAGNVFEWCQDWLGPLPGGFVTDPQGPPSNPIGWKIMRGGAFDFGGPACRSASRMFFGNHPGLTDWNLGFRVVLVTELQ